MASERQKLLVVVDGSEQSREVVRYVAGICAPKRIEVTLFHMLSPVSESFWDQRTAPESSGTEQHGGWLTRHQAAMEVFMDGALQVLHDNGFPDEAACISSERISVKVISGMATRGGTLYAQALHGSFGTIVVGRRGVSNVKTFPIGRVPMKLVQLINEQTVWVVSY